MSFFYKKDTHPIEINLNDTVIKSIPNMNVIGVCFDSKLTWALHVANAINKANKAVHAIKLTKKFFSSAEILQLLTSNFYSIL